MPAEAVRALVANPFRWTPSGAFTFGAGLKAKRARLFP
jgi:hypothetical protein